MATSIEPPTPTPDTDTNVEVDHSPRAIYAALGFGILPVFIGAVAFSWSLPSAPTHAQVVSSLNGVGATLVLMTAFAIIADVTVRFRQPKARVVALLDATVVSLGGWGAVFLALGVLDSSNYLAVLIATGIGVVLFVGSLVATAYHW